MKNQNFKQLYVQWTMDYKEFHDSGMTQTECAIKQVQKSVGFDIDLANLEKFEKRK